MAWRSRIDFSPTDKLHADDLNNYGLDIRTWGGDVNGGGFTLSNVKLVNVLPLSSVPVTSVFGRSGDVIAQTGDYTAAQVGAVPTARQIITAPGSGLSGGGPLSADVTLVADVLSFNTRKGAITLTPGDISNATGVLTSRAINTAAGSGLSGGGNLGGDLTLAVVPDSMNQRIQVLANDASVGTRWALNLRAGANVSITAVDNNAANRVDVTISAPGGSGGGMADPTNTLGDLIVRGPAATTRLPVGINGQVLTADNSVTSFGVKWATPTTAPVSSVFGRTGAVVAMSGDYQASQVTNALDSTQTYNLPNWLGSVAWGKIAGAPAFMVDPTSAKGDLIVRSGAITRMAAGADGLVLTTDATQALGLKWAPAVLADSQNQRVQVLSGNALIGTRHAISFSSGANTAITVTDDAVNNRVNISVATTGGGSGGGMVDPTTTLGDLIVRGTSAVQNLPVGTDGYVLTCDSTIIPGVRWAVPVSAGSPQTPWNSDIYAMGHNLINVGSIGVNGTPDSTKARLSIVANGSEEGVNSLTVAPDGFASIGAANDVGGSLRMRSYGSAYATDPGLQSLEASGSLKILANAAELMRLTSGHVLIGTATDDGTNLLQVGGKVKSTAGGFVFPDGSTQTTAFTAAAAPVTSVFTRTGAVVALTGDYTAAQITNAVDKTATYSDPGWLTGLGWGKIIGAPPLLVDPTTAKGDLIVRGSAAPATKLSVGSNGWVLTADSSQVLGVKWGPAPGQTPWTSDIDAANHMLYSASQIGIGIASPIRKFHVAAVAAGGGATITGAGPSFSLSNADTEPNSNTQTMLFALATAAGHYGLPNAGDSAVATMGSARGDLYLSANLTGGGAAKNLILQYVGGSAGNVGVGVANPAMISGATGFPLAQITQIMGSLAVGGGSPGQDGIIQLGTGTFVTGSNWNWYGAIGQNFAIKTNASTDTYFTPLTHASVGYAAINFGSGITTFYNFQGATTGGGTITPTERMRITAAGWIGIGMTPGVMCDVNGDVRSARLFRGPLAESVNLGIAENQAFPAAQVAQSISFSVNTTANALFIFVKYSNNTQKTCSIALT